ncbi:MAG: hypothetical protein L0H74_00660 [Brachybacterium sp.]|nr:hypothetical protein [Brachybacterium sp.]
MSRIFYLIYATLLVLARKPREDERGAGAVEWLVIVGAGIAIAYFAGDSVMTFAKSAAGKLGK